MKLWPFARKAANTVAAQGTLADPDDRLWDVLTFGQARPTAAGEMVGPTSALRVPAVTAAIRAISETVASLDVRVMRLSPDGTRREDLSHEANAILARPNAWTGRYPFMLQLVQDACRHGIGGAVAVRVNGRVRELLRQHPGNLGPTFDRNTGEPSYKVGHRIYGWRDVVSVVPVPPGENGEVVSLVSLCRESVGFAMVLQQHGSRLFSAGGRPGGVLSLKGTAGPHTLKNIKAAWDAAHGAGTSGATAILPADLTYEQLALSSVDQQFLELWKLSVLEVARTFRVPPVLVGDLEKATLNNSEEFGKQFVALCIKPWCELLADAFERVLFAPEERGQLFIEFSFEELLKPNTQALFDSLAKAATTFLTPDEARAYVGLGPALGGNHLRVPGNTVRADAPPPAPAPLPSSPPPPAPPQEPVQAPETLQ